MRWLFIVLFVTNVAVFVWGRWLQPDYVAAPPEPGGNLELLSESSGANMKHLVD